MTHDPEREPESDRDRDREPESADALVAALAAYRAIGTPEELVQGLAERDALRDAAEALRREQAHGEAAALAGFKPGVLARLAAQDGVAVVVVEARDRFGNPARVAAVETNANGIRPVPLAEYAEAHWKDFLPALKVEAARSGQGGSPPGRTLTPPRPTIAHEPGGVPVRRRNVF
jgi:hypothetical protein